MTNNARWSGRRRAVITGAGLVSPAGNDVDTFWRALTEGRSPLARIPDEVRKDLPCHAAGFVNSFDMPGNDLEGYRRPKGRLPRFVQFALAAAAGAWSASGLGQAGIDRDRLGVIVGNGSGGLPLTLGFYETYREKGWPRVDPQFLVQIIPNVVTAHLAAAFGARGYNATHVAACASGTQAIGEAALAVRDGRCDAVIAGGTEAWLTEAGLISFAVLGALSKWDGDPVLASRPFDRRRDGFVPSEGAAMLVIEEAEQARARGAEVLAEVAGYACTNDAYHVVAPDPRAVASSACIVLALADAGLRADDVDYVNAHGTATVRGDAAETEALKRALGERAYRVPVSATKSVLGHSMGASGALETIAAVQTLRTGVIHPTINLKEPDPSCDLDYVPGEARRADISIALKPSFGFGGHNACLVLRRVDG